VRPADDGCAIATSGSGAGLGGLVLLLPPALLIWKRRRAR
jgi:hypothetical protein